MFYKPDCLRKTFTGLLTALLGVALNACINQANPSVGSYAVGKVGFVTGFPRGIEIKGTQIELTPEAYGSKWIACIVDTTLILEDSDGVNGYFQAYSTGSHMFLGSFINKGRGPGEYPYSPKLLPTEQPGMVCLADSYTGETVYKHLDSLLKSGYASAMTKAASKVFGYMGISSLRYIDGSIRIVAQSYFSPNNKAIFLYGIFNDTVKLREVQIFNFTTTDGNATGLDAIAVSAAYSPISKKLFCAFGHFNQINVYSLSGDPEFTICVSKEKKLYTQQDFNNTSRVTRRYFYEGAVCSDKYLFALYYDLPAVDYEMNKEAFPVIQVFTVEGKPVAELRVKEKLTDIEFDPVHNRLYGFTGNEELLYYDLNGIGLK